MPSGSRLSPPTSRPRPRASLEQLASTCTLLGQRHPTVDPSLPIPLRSYQLVRFRSYLHFPRKGAHGVDNNWSNHWSSRPVNRPSIGSFPTLLRGGLSRTNWLPRPVTGAVATGRHHHLVWSYRGSQSGHSITPLRLLGPLVRDNWPGRLSCILVRPLSTSPR